jgi:FkbM family methyltransferase
VILAPTTYYDKIALRANVGDWICFEQIFRYLCYAPLEKLKPIRTVVDAGANIGLSSIFFTKRLNSPEIIALEPEESNFCQAVRNTKHLYNVKMLKAALWPRKQRLWIHNLTRSGSLGYQVTAISNPKKQEVASFEVLTIPEILDQRGWTTLDLLKIDIEGGERELFGDESCNQWLNKVRVIVVELHDKLMPGCSTAFCRAMATLENIEMSISGENIIIVNKNVAE